MSHKINTILAENLLQHREEWLSEKGLTEGDVIQDDSGEYVLVYVENGTAGEEGYDVYLEREYLPTSLRLELC